MIKTVVHKSETRGHANHGWLNSFQTFSFSGYHDPARIHFGALRVLNDDTVAGGMGFGKHPHDNMEIISIPLEGDLEHQDSMGNSSVIRKGEVQIMSAGTGIYHSEKNKNHKKPVKFLQIWVFPEKRNIEPRYDQQFFEAIDRENRFQTIVSPAGTADGGVKINQKAWFSLVDFSESAEKQYEIKRQGNGVYVFILKGQIEINGEILKEKDGMGISDTGSFTIRSSEHSEVL